DETRRRAVPELPLPGPGSRAERRGGPLRQAWPLTARPRGAWAGVPSAPSTAVWDVRAGGRACRKQRRRAGRPVGAWPRGPSPPGSLSVLRADRGAAPGGEHAPGSPSAPRGAGRSSAGRPPCLRALPTPAPGPLSFSETTASSAHLLGVAAPLESPAPKSRLRLGAPAPCGGGTAGLPGRGQPCGRRPAARRSSAPGGALLSRFKAGLRSARQTSSGPSSLAFLCGSPTHQPRRGGAASYPLLIR
ncbi:PREDICTED: translation initiation factor IF-2-like, partial [Chinchilla lanigera]|uniref:translation initiation factor IF-2-like n=1 Tax=Chinchilla lanigera TaxID=34839 RepID=UPI0006990C59